MEDILSSIKRIIAEEGDGGMASSRPRRGASARPALPPIETGYVEDEEILELSEPVKPAQQEQPAKDRAEAPVKQDAETILSNRAAEASRGSLDALSRIVVKPEAPGSDSLEAMVREMLRPMLADWLDAKLPGLVEAMVAREIARITGQSR